MYHLEDTLSNTASRLRSPTPENIAEDAELVRRGILDHDSMLSGYEFHNHPVGVTVHDKDGNLIHVRRSHNLRTNKGGHDEALALTSGAGSGAQYIGLSTATIVPNAQDTTLSGELTTLGLGRALATFIWVTDPSVVNPNQPSTLPGSYKLQATWTATGSVTGIALCGVFNAPSGGDLWFEATFGSINVNAGDTVNLYYIINY